MIKHMPFVNAAPFHGPQRRVVHKPSVISINGVDLSASSIGRL